MFADTAAIGAAGADLSHTAADLTAVAAILPTAAASSAALLGPVGAGFLSALATALTDVSRAVTQLGDGVAGAAVTAGDSSAAYAGTEHRVGQTIATLGG